MRFYLAARYSRRLELCSYREDLAARGHEVTSRWLDGVHEARDKIATENEWEIWAQHDYEDIRRADALIAFTESGGGGRGGRHVELGIAIGMHKDIWVVGPVESLFYTFYGSRWDSWADALVDLDRPRAGLR